MNSNTRDSQQNIVKEKYTFGQNRWVNFHGSRTYKSFSFSYHSKLTNKYRYRKKTPEKPPSPLPGSEEYTNRLISEKSDFIKQQLNLGSPVRNQSFTSINCLESNSVSTHDNKQCSENDDESKKGTHFTKKKKKLIKSSPVKEYSEEEIYDRVFNFLAGLSHDKKKKLINSDASSNYDVVCQQTGIKERVIVNRILRDFITKSPDNIDDHVNPSVKVEVDALPENLINVLGLESTAFGENSHHLALPLNLPLEDELTENDLDRNLTSPNEINVKSISDDTDKIEQSNVALMLKSLQEILEVDQIPINTKNSYQPKNYTEIKSNGLLNNANILTGAVLSNDPGQHSQKRKNSKSNKKRKNSVELNFTEDVTLNDSFFKTFGVNLDNESENATHQIKDENDDALFEGNTELSNNSEIMETYTRTESGVECPKMSSSPKKNVETTANSESCMLNPTSENNLMNESNNITRLETLNQKEIQQEGKCISTETTKNDLLEQTVISKDTKELLNEINKKTLIVVVPKLTNISSDSVSLNKYIENYSDAQNTSPEEVKCTKMSVPTAKVRIVPGPKKGKTRKRAIKNKPGKFKDETIQTEHCGNPKVIYDQVKKRQLKLQTMIRQIMHIDKKLEELNKKRQDLFIQISTFSVLDDINYVETPKRKRKKRESKGPISNENKTKKRKCLGEEARLIEQALNENEGAENVSARTYDLECQVHLNEELIFKIPLKSTDLNTSSNVGSSLWIIDTEGNHDTSLNLVESTDTMETTSTRIVDENFEVEFKDYTGNITVIEVFQNNVLAGSTSGFVYVYEILTGQLTEALRVSELPITCIVLTEADKNNSFYIGTHDPTLNIYSVCDKQLQTVTINEGSQCMDFSWDYIFIGSCNGSIMRFNTKTEKIEFHSKISDKNVLAIKATQEGPRRVLLLGLRDSRIYIRDAMSGLPMRSLCDDSEKTIYSLCLSNNIVYCGTNQSDVFCYRFSDGEFVTKFHTTSSRSVSFIEICGNLLFAGCYNSKIHIYDIESGAFLSCLDGPDGILMAMKVWGNVIIASTKHHFKAWRIPGNYLH